MKNATALSADFIESQIEIAYSHLVSPDTRADELQAWNLKLSEWHGMRSPETVARIEEERGLRKAGVA